MESAAKARQEPFLRRRLSSVAKAYQKAPFSMAENGARLLLALKNQQVGSTTLGFKNDLAGEPVTHYFADL